MLMRTRRALPIAALSLWMIAPARAATGAGLRIETDVSFTANLVHWVDNLAGTSVGKTMYFYHRYWEERFGPFDAADRLALEEFARVRRMPVPTPLRAVANPTGCLPVENDALGWNQLFLAEAMEARSLSDLREALAGHIGVADAAVVMASLERFRPRFERVWKDLAYIRRFDARFRRYLGEGDLPRYLESLGGFFGVVPAPERPMKISFIGLPWRGGPTHAEADGDHLLIEIRPDDAPRDQVQVVAHESSHFLMRMMSAEQLDRLARQSFGEGEAGALFWRYMWEGMPTALGQGVAEARLSPGTFSLTRPWYHIDVIDRFAKLIYPAMAQAVGGSRRIDEGLVPTLTRELRASPLMRDARAAEFLMTAFYASGDGLADDMERLRARLGLGRAGSNAFDLHDPAFALLLRHYSCLGGVALVGPAELERAATVDGTPLLSDDMLKQAREQAARGLGVIATGRRAAGAPVYFLVAPGPGLVAPLIDAFSRLRGVPDRPLLVTGSP